MYKYKDINDTQGKIDYDYNAILDCLENIMTTEKGTLPFKRNFGINMEKYLFEPFSPFIVPLIRGEVTRSLRVNCPYLDKIKVLVIPDPYTESYKVDIEVTAKGLPDIITTFKVFKRLNYNIQLNN